MKTQPQVNKAPVVEPIDSIPEGDTPMKTQSTRIVIGVYAVLVLLGIGTGYLLSRANVIKTDKVAGSTDTKTFKDSAIGVVQKDGTDGEGTHQLLREGGPSQTVTLMSSVIDLNQYVGKKVKVYGQTMAAQKAAWLMDVGRVELQ